MTLARWCRRAAWTIVLLAVVDPAVPASTRALPRVAVIREDGSAAGERAVRALEQALEGVAVLDPGAASGADAYVLIADGYPVARPPLPTGAPVHVLAPPVQAAPVTIRAVTAPARAVLRLPLAVNVDVARHDDRPERTRLRVVERGAVLAVADVSWRAGQRQARISLRFVPSRTGPVRLRVIADAGAPPSHAAADVLIDVRDVRFDVRVTGPRASWALAFAAAALREDDRLIVSSRFGTRPGSAVSVGPPPSDAAREPDVEVHGISEESTAADIARIQRSAERGAGVILVPDRGLPVAVRRLAGIREIEERVLPAPTAASNGVRAGEWLLANSGNPAASTLSTVRIGNRDYPLAIDVPLGAGRIVLVTALDAWRYRADPAFSRFWRATVVELAARQFEAASPLRISPGVVRPGGRVTVTYEAAVPAKADRIPITLRAHGSRALGHTLVRTGGGSFTGRINAPTGEGVYEASVAAADGVRESRGYVAVARDAATAAPDDERALRALAAAHRGAFATDAERLADALRETVARRVRGSTRPMRWPVWPAIVALLLGTDWWTRRRNGLR